MYLWAQIFAKNFGCATRRGIANFTLWTAASVCWLGTAGAPSGHSSGHCRGGMSHPECAPSRRRQPGVILGHKERGGPHTQRPTPHVPGTVISAASHRYPEFHGRCRRDEESSTTLWCLLARLSRGAPPTLSASRRAYPRGAGGVTKVSVSRRA